MKKVMSIAISLLLIITMLAGCSGGEGVNAVTAYDTSAADYTLDINAGDEIRSISDLLYGIFFEDINFAADGGLYAEKVANRSFEFTELAKDDHMYAWSVVGDAAADVRVNDADGALNTNNTSYLVLSATGDEPAGVQNRGFLEGMAISKGKYDFSIYAKGLDGYTGGITVCLVVGDKIVDEGRIDAITSDWQKYDLTLESKGDATEDVYIRVLIDKGSAALDMVSLFPQDTYKSRPNGLRADIATMLAELSPKFLRFPGGCVIEGYDSDTAYDWKASVGATVDGEPLLFNGKYGDVAARRQGTDIWTDINATDDEYPGFMTYGLGFYEFFQLAEDIGAVGVPVVNCGLYCQARGGKAVDINSDEFRRYIQDMLDLVEFCRGDADTTWGAVRASMGHKEPFDLRYICVGNENWGKDYYARYDEFVKAFNKARAAAPDMYDGIELVYSSGTDDATSSRDYIKAYQHAEKKMTDTDNDFAGAIDQHYYNDAAWFLRNTDYYDDANYSRTAQGMSSKHGGRINVFLGEYASWSNRMYSALAECAYMTGLERNGDIVAMSTYAPLMASTTASHWAPDLIWFNNSGAIGSVNYYTQMLFARNQGTKVLQSSLGGAYIGDRDIGGRLGVGTWATSASFDNIRVTDNAGGNVLAEYDFSSDAMADFDPDQEGQFDIRDGALVQSSTDAQTTDNGSVLYFGDSGWSNFTYTLDATKLAGEEGFFLPIMVGDDSRYYWNIGGYGNTVSCLQRYAYGYKSGQLEGTVKDVNIKDGRTYHLKVVADKTHIRCYIDDELYVDYDTGSATEAEAYQVVSTDDSGDIIIKLVNITGSARTFAINVANADVDTMARVSQVKADDIAFENVYGENKQETMATFDIKGVSPSFNYTVPKYSATVIRMKRSK